VSRQRQTAEGLLCFLIFFLAAGFALTATSTAKEMGTTGGAQGVVTEQDGASYRYVTVNPQTKPALTIVERIGMSDGAIDRWWYRKSRAGAARRPRAAAAETLRCALCTVAVHKAHRKLDE
jgi:hypothetical protein